MRAIGSANDFIVWAKKTHNITKRRLEDGFETHYSKTEEEQSSCVDLMAAYYFWIPCFHNSFWSGMDKRNNPSVNIKETVRQA